MSKHPHFSGITTITVVGGHEYKKGDIVRLVLLDMRWWMRVWCWVLRRPAPVRVEFRKITVEAA